MSGEKIWSFVTQKQLDKLKRAIEIKISKLEKLKQQFIDSCVNKERHERLHKNSFKRQKRMESVLKDRDRCLVDILNYITEKPEYQVNDYELLTDWLHDLKEELEGSEKVEKRELVGVGGAAPTRNAEREIPNSYNTHESDDSKEPCPLCAGEKLEEINEIEDKEKRYYELQDFINKLLNKEKEPSIYPNDCSECVFFGDKPKHSNILGFGFLCQKDLYWTICGGKQGIRKKESSDDNIDWKKVEKVVDFVAIEKFIPPRNIKCSDCMANPIPKLIDEFQKIIDKTIIRMKGKYGYRAKGNEYLEKILNQELKDLKRGRQ